MEQAMADTARLGDEELDLYYGGRAKYLASVTEALRESEERLTEGDFEVTEQWAVDFGMTPETERRALESKIANLRAAIAANE